MLLLRSLPSCLVCLSLLFAVSLQPAASQDGNSVRKTINIDTTSGTQNLKDEEKYQDFTDLNEDNFEELVLEAEDPWIVLFTDGRIQKDWKELAVTLRGIIGFGMIHRLQQEDLLDEIDFDADINPVARVYRYGSSKQKSKWTDVKTPKEAREIAVKSLPDITKEVQPTHLQDFLFDSYLNRPSTFPAIFIIEKEMSPVFKALALHYKRYFNFGTVTDPKPEDLLNLQYNLDMPGFLVLVSQDYTNLEIAEEEGDEHEYKFQSIAYTVARQGEMNYPNLVKFLYSINLQYRQTLPGENMAEDQEVLTMEEVMEVEGQRFDVRYMNDLMNVKGVGTEKLKKDSKGKKIRNNSSKKIKQEL